MPFPASLSLWPFFGFLPLRPFPEMAAEADISRTFYTHVRVSCHGDVIILDSESPCDGHNSLLRAVHQAESARPATMLNRVG